MQDKRRPRVIEINKPWGNIDGRVYKETRIAMVDTLSINLPSRRLGYGSKLYREFESEVMPDVDSINLEVYYRNAVGIKFWESHGFKYTGPCCNGYLEYVKVLAITDKLR